MSTRRPIVSAPDVSELLAPVRRVLRARTTVVTGGVLRRSGVILVRWVIPVVSLLAAAAYVWAAVVWQANPPAIPIVGRSMQPNLWAGDMVVVRSVEPTSLKVGDVITVRVTATDRATWGMPEYVTHRIVKIDGGASGLRIRTRGDNNTSDDPFVTRGPSVHGKMVLRVPKMGMVVLFFMSRQGIYTFAGLIALAVLWFLVGALEKRRIDEEEVEETLRAVLDEVRQVSVRLDPSEAVSPLRPTRALPAVGAAPGDPAPALQSADVRADAAAVLPVITPAPRPPVTVPRPASVSRSRITLPPLAMDVRGRSIIVTGATGRMGGAVARALHDGGARLTLTGRDPERLQELLDELPGALVVRADLCKADMPEKLVARALRAHGSVHGLVNAAALGDDGALLDVTDSVLAEVLQANVLLPVRLIRAIAPHLEAGGFVCNLGARPPAVRGTGATVQATVRATMTVMSSVLEWELADRGIRMLDMLGTAPARPVAPPAPAPVTAAATAGLGAALASDGDVAVEDEPVQPALRVVR